MALPETMLAAQVVEFHKPYKLSHIPLPPSSPSQGLSPHSILIKVAVASFCHTDLMIMNGELFSKGDGSEQTPSGLSGSHEPSGTIAAMGEEAKAAGFKIGDRIIALGSREPCGKCEECTFTVPSHGLIVGSNEGKGGSIQTKYQYCGNMLGFVGGSLPGAFQEYTIVDSRFSVRLPDRLSFASAAPLTCAGTTAWRALNVAITTPPTEGVAGDLAPGSWIGIVGSGGGLGHLEVQFAKKRGFRVVGLDARDDGLALTKRLGADVVVDVRGKTKEQIIQSVLEGIKAITPNSTAGGVDRAIILSDHSTAIGTGCAITKKHGLVVQVAQPKDLIIPFHELIFRDIRIVGSLISSPAEFRDMVEFVYEKKVEVMTKMFYGLESLEEVVKEAESGKTVGKLVVAVDKEAVERDQKVEGIL